MNHIDETKYLAIFSEIFVVAVKCPKISSWNDENIGVFYATGKIWWKNT